MTLTDIPQEKIFDVRDLPCSVKHPMILQRWEETPVGDFFVLVNGHDPKPLRYQIEAEYGKETLGWEYVAETQEAVAVKVIKIAQPAPRSSQAAPQATSCGNH